MPVKGSAAHNLWREAAGSCNCSEWAGSSLGSVCCGRSFVCCTVNWGACCNLYNSGALDCTFPCMELEMVSAGDSAGGSGGTLEGKGQDLEGGIGDGGWCMHWQRAGGTGSEKGPACSGLRIGRS